MDLYRKINRRYKQVFTGSLVPFYLQTIRLRRRYEETEAQKQRAYTLKAYKIAVSEPLSLKVEWIKMRILQRSDMQYTWSDYTINRYYNIEVRIK